MIRKTCLLLCWLTWAVVGCSRSPAPPPPVKQPPLTKFTFPTATQTDLQLVEQPIPTGIKVEFVIPLKELEATKKVDLVLVRVRATNENRTTVATAQLRRSGNENGIAVFNGTVNRVIQKGRVIVHVTTPDGGELAQYDARYE